MALEHDPENLAVEVDPSVEDRFSEKVTLALVLRVAGGRRREVAGRVLGRCFPGLFKEAEKLAVHGLVAGGDMAVGKNGVAAVEIADKTAGLADQQHAGRQVPGRQITLPECVKAAGGDPGQIERRGAEAAQARIVLLRGGDFITAEHQIAAAIMRQPAGDDRVGEALPSGDADPPVVEESALAALGDEQVVVGGVVGQRRDNRGIAFKRDGDRKVGDAVQEVGGAVERIDDPAMTFVGTGARAAFLAEEAVIRPRLWRVPGARFPRRGDRPR